MMIERLTLPPNGETVEVGANELEAVSLRATAPELETFQRGLRSGQFVLVDRETKALPCLRPRHLGRRDLEGLSPKEFSELAELRARGRVVVADGPEP